MSWEEWGNNVQIVRRIRVVRKKQQHEKNESSAKRIKAATQRYKSNAQEQS
jgi:hypothetical protein